MNPRCCRAARGIGPAAVLLLLPKCPACFAAYLALAGIAVSPALAGTIRTGVAALCTALLAWFLAQAAIGKRRQEADARDRA